MKSENSVLVIYRYMRLRYLIVCHNMLTLVGFRYF